MRTPKTVDSKRFSFIRSRISGEAERKKYMLEDPFVFRGIIHTLRLTDSLYSLTHRLPVLAVAFQFTFFRLSLLVNS